MATVNVKVSIVSKAAQLAVSGLAKDAKVATKNFFSLNLAIKDGNKFLSTFGANLAANLTTKAITSIVSGFGSLARNIFESTKALEVAAVQFEVLTGSAGAANEIIRDLQDFTARTPFKFESVAKAAQGLLAFGFTTEQVKDNLQDLGDVSAASGADINELSLIYGQVAAAGKLTGERLLQLQERAIPIGPALAKSLGVAESSVRALVSKGAVDLETFEKAFKSLNDEGQFAFNGIEKASRTLQGRLSTLSDNVDLFSAGIGERLSPALKAGTTALTEFVQQLSKDEGFNNFLDNVADSIPGAVRFLANTLVTLIEVFNAVRVVANSLVGVFFLITSGALDAAQATLQIVSAMAEFTGVDTTGIDDAVKSLQNLQDAAASTAADLAIDNEKINQSTKELSETINSGADTLIVAYEREKQAAEETANAVVDSNTKKVESTRQVLTLQQLLQQEFQAAEDERIANLGILEQEKAVEELDFLVTNLGEQEAARIAARAKQLEGEGKTDQALKVIRDGRVKAQAEQTKAIKKQKDQELSDQNTFLSTSATLANSQNSTLAAIGKAAALTQLAIKTPEAVASSFAFGSRIGGPPLGFAFGGIAATAMAAQAAKIAGLSFQQGGIVPGSSFAGDNIVARVNSGEMILNRQQQSNLFDIANTNQGSGQSSQVIQTNVTVELDGEVVGNSVSRQVANGLVLGEGGV